MQNPLSPLNPLNMLSPLLPKQEETVQRRRKAIMSLKARADAKRSFAEKLADVLTSKFGSVTFLILNLIWFAIWIPINMNLIPGIEPFDPFPFGLLTMVVSLEAIALAVIVLTMVVSLEAIALAVIVLISQNREARISELREEIDLQINTISDSELTKVLALLEIIMKKQGIDVNKPDIKKLLKPIDSAEMIAELEKELDPNSKK